MQALPGELWAQLGASWVVAWLLAACRCGPLLLAVPMLGLGGRLAALGLGTLLFAPLLAPAIGGAGATGPLGLGMGLLPLCARELLVGGTLALAAALPWAVAHAVGTLLDEVHSARTRPPLAAQLYGALALALFFGLGGARIALTALAASYELLPLPTLPHPLAEPGPGSLVGAARGLVTLSGQLLGLAIRLALPLLCTQLLAELLVTLPGRWLGAPRRSRPLLAARSLIWLGVLLLGAHALFPEFRQLLLLWPGLLRQALQRH